MNKYLKYGLAAIGLGGIGYLTYRAYLKYQEEKSREEELVMTPEEIEEEIRYLKEHKWGMEGEDDPDPQAYGDDISEEDEEWLAEEEEVATRDYRLSLDTVGDQPVVVEASDSMQRFITQGHGPFIDQLPIRKEVDSKLEPANPGVNVFDTLDNNYISEEVDVAKYKNNAEHQEAYIDYRLRRFAEHSDRFKTNNLEETVRRLFQVPFNPTGDRDKLLVYDIRDERSVFFGDNKLVYRPASFAELVLHYADIIEDEIGGEAPHYVDEWLYNLGVSLGTGQASLERLIANIVAHNHVTTKGLYGLFSLDKDYWDRVGNEGRGVLTFEGEYSAYVDYMLDICEPEEDWEDEY